MPPYTVDRDGWGFTCEISHSAKRLADSTGVEHYAVDERHDAFWYVAPFSLRLRIEYPAEDVVTICFFHQPVDEHTTKLYVFDLRNDILAPWPSRSRSSGWRPSPPRSVWIFPVVLVSDSDGPEAGALRERQVFIGTKNGPITDARFIPPPPGDKLVLLFDGWLGWVNDESLRESLQLLVRVALVHYQFETIHPYTDGNGRVGRLVAVLQLLTDGALKTPVLSISDWLKDRGSEYRDHLLRVSVTGEWAPWVDFFARAVTAAADDARRRVIGLLALQADLSARARQALPRARLALEIADDLIAFPILNVAAAQTRYGKSNQTNRNAVNQLCDVGLLEPYGDARYDRLYWNRRVFEIIES